MTISTTASSATFLGNGATTEFNFSFIADNAAEISVLYTDGNGVQTALASNQYTLILNPPATGSLHSVGGTVTYPTMGSPIASGTSLTVRRLLPLLQLTSISNQGNFYPEVVEEALDTLCLQTQQISARTGQQRGTWVSGADYSVGDLVQDGANGANTLNYYTCIVSNTSGTWATDLAAGYWSLTFNTAAVIDYVDEAEAAAAAALASEIASAASASTATTQAGIATAEAAAAAVSAGQAADYAASYSGTSTTSLAIGTGAKVFTTQADKLWVNGQFLQIASDANAGNYMHGSVTSYSGATLTMDITDIGGAGTFADWNISISGTQGTPGDSDPSDGNKGDIIVTDSGLTWTMNPAADITVNSLALNASTSQIVLDADGVNTGTISLQALSGSRTWSFPNNSGTLLTSTNVGSTVQAYDAFLQSLSSLGTAANSFVISSGVNTAAEIAIAANQFAARASTGSLAAKPVTDFALTLLDDADAATAKSTLGITKFTSSELTVAAGNAASVAHGLGAQPTFVTAQLICKTADFGYSVGDVINNLTTGINPNAPYGTGGSYGANATDVFYAICPTWGIYITAKTGASNTFITSANWRLILTAFIL